MDRPPLLTRAGEPQNEMMVIATFVVSERDAPFRQRRIVARRDLTGKISRYDFLVNPAGVTEAELVLCETMNG